MAWPADDSRYRLSARRLPVGIHGAHQAKLAIRIMGFKQIPLRPISNHEIGEHDPHFWKPSPGFQIASNSLKAGAIKAGV